jgi:hypothetical protein
LPASGGRGLQPASQPGPNSLQLRARLLYPGREEVSTNRAPVPGAARRPLARHTPWRSLFSAGLYRRALRW